MGNELSPIYVHLYKNNDAIQYHHVIVSNRDVFDQVFRFNFIIIMHKFYQVDIHGSHFGSLKIHFNSIYQRRNSPDTFKHIFC